MTTQTSIGARLRSARESRGLQLAEIAGTLRIKPQFLDALESDRPEALPTPTHASGFLRTYARYLGVELAAAAAPAVPPLVTPLAPVQARPGRLAALLPLLLVLGGLIILYLLWRWLQAPEPAPIAPPPADFGMPKAETVPPEPQAAAAPVVPTPAVASAPFEKPAETPVQTPAEPAKPAAKAEPAKPETLVVRAVSDAWVQITDATGRQLYSRLMRAGEVWRAPQQPGLRLSTGNAGGLVLVRNGEAGAPLGAQAQVLHNLALTAPAKVAPAAAAPSVPAAANAGAADTEE